MSTVLEASASASPAQPISQAAAVAAMLRITYAFNTCPLSDTAEKMLHADPMVASQIPLDDPIKISRNLRRLSKYVEPFEVTDPADTKTLADIKSLWAENHSEITTLIVNSLAEELSPDNTVELISLYGEQLDLVENLLEIKISEYEPLAA
jgi:hypothetical protein